MQSRTDREFAGQATVSVPGRGMVRRHSPLPGFRLTFFYTLAYLAIIVIFPLTGLMVRPIGIGWDRLIQIAGDPRVIAALRLSFGAACLAAFVDAGFGLLIAWVLVRYRFPGRRILDALVDLPFALPTAVAGIALTALYAPNGWIGAGLAKVGIKVAYTPLGIVIALIFIGLPFVIRTVEPVLEDLDREIEEAAVTLGAGRLKTVLLVVLPVVLPALVTGFALAFARSIGEYGSIIFIAGNMPMVSEIAPLLIVIKLEQFDYAGAAVIGVLLLMASFALLLAINRLHRRTLAWSIT
jgi:sulfate/thiosulfate transport system permease protein